MWKLKTWQIPRLVFTNFNLRNNFNTFLSSLNLPFQIIRNQLYICWWKPKARKHRRSFNGHLRLSRHLPWSHPPRQRTYTTLWEINNNNKVVLRTPVPICCLNYGLRKKDGKHRTAYIAAESGDSLLCFFDLLIGINHEYGALLCFLWAFCVSSGGILSLARPVWKTCRGFCTDRICHVARLCFSDPGLRKLRQHNINNF